MKYIVAMTLLVSFTVQASPLMTMKERLRLHMWTFGLEDRPVKQKLPVRLLPEEIERPLRKM